MKPLKSYADVKQIKKPKGPKERFEELKDEKLRGYVRGLPCALQGQQRRDFYRCSGLVQVAHVKSKGAAGGDWDNVIPLCEFHHMDQHRVGIKSFEYHYNLRLKPLARKVTAAYLKAQKSK